MDNETKALRLQEIKAEVQAIFAFGRGRKALDLCNEWAHLCGNFPTASAIERFIAFVEGGPDD